MARMTALDLVTELRLSLGGETEETLSNTQLLRWINRAYLELASNYNFSELETSTTFTAPASDAEPEITGVSNILEILSITNNTNKFMLYAWDRNKYDQSVQGNSSTITGPPVYWFKSGQDADGLVSITLYPTPAANTSLTVVYRQLPTELVLSPSPTSSVLLQPWDEVMLLMAISKGWRALGDDDKSYKAQLSANSASKLAEKSAFVASYEPYSPTSVVARALG